MHLAGGDTVCTPHRVLLPIVGPFVFICCFILSLRKSILCFDINISKHK